MKWNNFKKSFQHNSMETRLADKQKHRLCSICFKKIFLFLLKNILSNVDKAEKTQVTNQDQEKPRHLFTSLPSQSFPQIKHQFQSDQSDLHSFCPIKVFYKAKMMELSVWPELILRPTASKWPTSIQGCISCGILVSGIGARGVSLEHMENMEMFSCSPT